MSASETIVAPATPQGSGGLAVIRISGPEAVGVLEGCFVAALPCSDFQSHRLYLGVCRDAGGRDIDQVMAVLMRGPHSYTGEDVAEIHCHGGPVIVRQIIDLVLARGGRLAGPGEFTQRAFVNGRLDLAQAEAVADLIGAESNQAARIALSQLEGRLSQLVHDFRTRLLTQLALLETHIDFNDEDIALPDLDGVAAEIVAIRAEIQQLIASFDSGRLLQDGVRILLLGKPNVGKSSLLNTLLGQARAIVTEIPGTTRDTIEEQMQLGGLPVRLIDSAGVRQTEDPVEIEGVRRARDKVAGADLVLLLVDGSRDLDDDDVEALAACERQRLLLVVNKTDLGHQPLLPAFAALPQVAISLKASSGLEELQQRIHDLLTPASGREGGENVLLYERRHLQALQRGAEALGGVLDGLAGGMPAELLALDLRAALTAIGEVTGETTPDQILEEIFARFCIGK